MGRDGRGRHVDRGTRDGTPPKWGIGYPTNERNRTEVLRVKDGSTSGVLRTVGSGTLGPIDHWGNGRRPVCPPHQVSRLP